MCPKPIDYKLAKGASGVFRNPLSRDEVNIHETDRF